MGSFSCNGLVSQMFAEWSEPNGQRSLISIRKLEKPKATALHTYMDPTNPSLVHDNHGGDDDMMLRIMTMQLIKTLQLMDMNKILMMVMKVKVIIIHPIHRQGNN
jgi:hypothetical protein